MTDKNLFEQATRLKLRFASPVGALKIEDLWDLPLTSKTGRANLDDIARAYSRELKSQDEESFVEKPAKRDKLLQLGFDLVKHIIDVKIAERDAIKAAADKKAKKDKIMELIVKKKDEAMGAMSVEELQKQLEALAD